MKRTVIVTVVGLMALLLVGGGLADIGLFEDGEHHIIRGAAELAAAVAFVALVMPRLKRQKRNPSRPVNRGPQR